VARDALNSRSAEPLKKTRGANDGEHSAHFYASDVIAIFSRQKYSCVQLK
jgi:hypothetical protein